MKSSFIVLFAVIIIGSLIWFNLPPKEAEAPVAETTQVETVPVNSASSDDMTSTENQDEMMQSDVSSNNDIGMELPETDMTDRVPPATQKMFTVHGTNFAFDVKEIRVKEGDTVMIHFMSADGFHDLVIDEFNAKTEKVQTGGMAMVTFTASKKGTFEYYCSVGKHRMNGMIGKLIVE